jgi:hypothetical protein
LEETDRDPMRSIDLAITAHIESKHGPVGSTVDLTPVIVAVANGRARPDVVR